MRPSAYNKGLRKGNRTDLPLPATGAASQPPAAGTGMAYGERKSLMDAQRAVPLARQGGAPASAGPGTPPSPVAGAPDPSQVESAFAAMPFPDTKLNDPTQRPGEPITAGLANFQPPQPQNNDDLDVAALTPHLPVLELMANQPSASIATRNYIRRLRAAAVTRNGPV